MKLNDLKESHLIEIVKLYDKHCGIGLSFDELMYHHDASSILKELKEECKKGDVEYSVISRWSMRSKLFFSIAFGNEIEIRYSSNLDRDDSDFAEAEKAGEEFVKVAMQYLSQSNSKS